MSRTKILGIVIIALVVIYLIYSYWKTAKTPKSYPLEEVHEHGNGETTWVCIVKDDDDDSWRIISNRTGKLWAQHYDTRGDAEDALQAYHANR